MARESSSFTTIPCTEGQRAIWSASRASDDASRAHNESCVLRLRGKLDVEALRRAIGALVCRHEALRSCFPSGGELMRVADQAAVDMPFVELAADSASERDRRVAELYGAEVETAFDVEHGPLLRTRIVSLGADDHLLLLTLHHLICDGWSVNVLVSDLQALYAAARSGTTPNLPPADSFRDYALDEQQRTATTRYREAERLWLATFADLPPMLDLPTDHVRPAVKTHRGAREAVRLRPELVSGLRQLAAETGCTFVSILLAAYQVFLYRLTGQKDLLVALPVAGQPATGRFQLVGHCANLTPLRSRVDDAQPFLDYLKSIRSAMLDAHEHRLHTLGALIRGLPAPRDPGRVPLFNILQRPAPDALRFDGLECEFRSNPRHFENFDFTMTLVEAEGNAGLEFSFRTDLYEADTVRRRAAEFDALLAGIAAHPDARIAELPGRPDMRVQIQGHRVDLRDIEAVLLEHEAVREAAVVVATGPGSGKDRLAAYYVPAPGADVTVTVLRSKLQERLPGYMVPRYFVEVDALPLTSSGLVDPQRLPPAASRGTAAADGEPGTPQEIYLATLWKEMLKVEQVGTGDNFFSLGGHSLVSIQFISRVEKDTGTRLEPRSVLQSTLGQLAAQCAPTPVQQAPPLGARGTGMRTLAGWLRKAAPALLLTILLGTRTAADDTSLLRKGDLVMFAGDSITDEGLEPKGFVTLVADAVQERYPHLAIRVAGTGAGWDTVASLRRRFDKDVLDRRPNVVVVLVGGSDCQQPYAGGETTRQIVALGYQDLIWRAQRAGARVVLSTLTVIGEKTDGTNPYDKTLDAYSEVIRQVAAEKKCVLVEARQRFLEHLKRVNTQNLPHGVLTRDGVHLNDAGNRLLADLMLEALTHAPTVSTNIASAPGTAGAEHPEGLDKP